MTHEETLLGAFRMIDLADEKGVHCSKLFADLGADVIKVEPPEGDRTRRWPPFVHDDPHLDKSLFFLHNNTNKRSVTLNLEHTDGQAILKKLVRKADVLLETSPPGYLKNLGLDYEALKVINPALVMASITPFGQSGPLHHYQSTDLISMAMSGVMQICGNPDGPPLKLGGSQSFPPAALYAASAIMMALYHREVSAVGQYIDISIQEALITFVEDKLAHQFWSLENINMVRSGNNRPAAEPWGIYECKDGWVFLCLASAAEWDTFAQLVSDWGGGDELLDPMYKGPVYSRKHVADIVRSFVSRFVRRFGKKELFAEGLRRGFVILPVNTPEDIARCPQLTHRSFFVEADHAVAGRLSYIGSPLYLDGIRGWNLQRTAPLLGEHNNEVYAGELGMTKDELLTLRHAGVI
ncbi:MAG: CoA transferase [Dehalococcoidia bacterium]|nr:CoA transferase [Dehalococcoidia bacterium]